MSPVGHFLAKNYLSWAGCVAGKETLLVLNVVIYAHKTQNLHLKNQCYIHVWNDDVSFDQTLTINLNYYYYIKIFLAL